MTEGCIQTFETIGKMIQNLLIASHLVTSNAHRLSANSIIVLKDKTGIYVEQQRISIKNIIEYQCNSMNSLETQLNAALIKLSIKDTAQMIVRKGIFFIIYTAYTLMA